MDRSFSESKVQEIVNKALLEGKIITTEFYLNYLDSLMKPKEELLEYLDKEMEFRSEKRTICMAEMGMINKIRTTFQNTLEALKKKKENV